MKVLYICTHNRCRSILSEALTNALNSPHLSAQSAGSQPAGEVHPLTLTYLKEANIPVAGLKSQSWDDFESFQPDVVITVCDSAAGETCPVYFGRALKLHWGLADPSKIQGSEENKARAFRKTISIIQARVNALEEIAQQNLPQSQLKDALLALSKNNSL